MSYVTSSIWQFRHHPVGRALADELGHTIIIITHDMPIVGLYAKRLIAMAQAEIIADGTTPAVFTQAEILKQAFLAPPQITQLAQSTQHLGFSPGTLSVEEMITQYKQLTN